jgi:hypothetical protein
MAEQLATLRLVHAIGYPMYITTSRLHHEFQGGQFQVRVVTFPMSYSLLFLQGPYRKALIQSSSIIASNMRWQFKCLQQCTWGPVRRRCATYSAKLSRTCAIKQIYWISTSSHHWLQSGNRAHERPRSAGLTRTSVIPLNEFEGFVHSRNSGSSYSRLAGFICLPWALGVTGRATMTWI